MQSTSIDFNRIIAGIIRAAKLDKTFFAEVEKDPSYTQDSLVIVVAVSVLSALGALLGSLFGGHAGAAIGTFIWSAVWGVGAFYLWVFLVQWIGIKFFKGQGDFGEVQRCLGYAYGPRLLGIFAVIPFLGGLAAFVGSVWSAVAGFFAIQEALDQDTTNALLTIVVSWVVVLVVGLIFGAILAGIGVLGAAIGGAF